MWGRRAHTHTRRLEGASDVLTLGETVTPLNSDTAQHNITQCTAPQSNITHCNYYATQYIRYTLTFTQYNTVYCNHNATYHNVFPLLSKPSQCTAITTSRCASQCYISDRTNATQPSCGGDSTITHKYIQQH